MPLFLLANNLFLGSIVAMLLWTLIRHRDTDSYRDNAFFLVMLPGFIVAKYLMLAGGDFTAGSVMAMGLFRLAFLVMLERTLTGFMKAAFQVRSCASPAGHGDQAARPAAGRRLPAASRPLGAPWRWRWRSCSASASSSGSRNWPSAASTSASCTSATWPSSASCWSRRSARWSISSGSARCRCICSPSAPWAASSRR
jgi:hypothetical protein